MGDIGIGSGTSYPVSLDTQSVQEVDSPSASKTRLRSAVPNDIIACTLAVQSTIGTTPQGTKADVKTFLQTQHAVAGTHSNFISIVNDYSGLPTRNYLYTYQNTTNKVLYVACWTTYSRGSTPGEIYLKILIGTTSTPTTVVSYYSVTAPAFSSGSYSVVGIVPVNWYYKITATANPSNWLEWS